MSDDDFITGCILGIFIRLLFSKVFWGIVLIFLVVRWLQSVSIDDFLQLISELIGDIEIPDLGEIPPPSDDDDPLPVPTCDYTVVEAYSGGLSNGQNAVVQNTIGQGLACRACPGKQDYSPEFWLSNGDIVTLRDGPVSVEQDSWLWWQIETQDQNFCWAAEDIWLAPYTVVEYPLILTPPYDGCDKTTIRSSTISPGDPQILSKGFSSAIANCELDGNISFLIVTLGGSEGGFISADYEPNQWSEAESSIVVYFEPNVTDTYRIEANLIINGQAGAAAGSDLVDNLNAPDLLFFPVLDYLASLPISTVIDLIKNMVLPTAATTESEVFLYVSEGGSSEVIVPLHPDLVASFPVPGPYSQSSKYENERIQISTEVPVIEGQEVRIEVGIKSRAQSWGMATSVVSFNNPDIKSQVESIVISLP